MSDSHNLHQLVNVPDGDILIHAGDICMEGNGHELENFIAWYGAQPHKYKIAIAGNHDRIFERRPELARQLMTDAGIIYLQDESVVIEGLKFYGTPWQPWFFDWAFNVPRGMLKPYWDKIPTDTDVLITHGPPKGVLDFTAPPQLDSVGCDELLTRVLEVKPKIHVFGHIHYGRGEKELNGTHFYNATVVNERYNVEYEPFVAEL